MSDIFLSYKSEDKAKAQIIAESLDRRDILSGGTGSFLRLHQHRDLRLLSDCLVQASHIS